MISWRVDGCATSFGAHTVVVVRCSQRGNRNRPVRNTDPLLPLRNTKKHGSQILMTVRKAQVCVRTAMRASRACSISISPPTHSRPRLTLSPKGGAGAVDPRCQLVEIHPVLMIGVTAACIPYIQCNQSPPLCRQANPRPDPGLMTKSKECLPGSGDADPGAQRGGVCLPRWTSMGRQSLASVVPPGPFDLSPALCYPQRPLCPAAVPGSRIDLIESCRDGRFIPHRPVAEHPMGQNFVIAVCPYGGNNQPTDPPPGVGWCTRMIPSCLTNPNQTFGLEPTCIPCNGEWVPASPITPHGSTCIHPTGSTPTNSCPEASVWSSPAGPSMWGPSCLRLAAFLGGNGATGGAWGHVSVHGGPSPRLPEDVNLWFEQGWTGRTRVGEPKVA